MGCRMIFERLIVKYDRVNIHIFLDLKRHSGSANLKCFGQERYTMWHQNRSIFTTELLST